MPAHYVRAAFRSAQVQTGNLVVNVVHLEVDTLTDPPDYQGIATDVNTWLGTAYNNVLSGQFRFTDITVTEETFPGAIPGQGVHTTGTLGARSAPDTDLSIALCCLVQLRTATPKKYARGHLFMPPAMSVGQTDSGGQWSSIGTYFGACTAFANLLAAGHTGGSTSYTPVVFSRTRVAQGATPFAFKVTAATAALPQHFLRSRLSSP